MLVHFASILSLISTFKTLDLYKMPGLLYKISYEIDPSASVMRDEGG